MHKRLWIPGPTEVSEDVLQEQAKPLIGHRSNDFTLLYDSVLKQLREYFKTEQHIIVMTASGSIFMDMTARNLITPNGKALCCVNGSFSSRMHTAILESGKNADLLEVEWGKAITVDKIKEKLELSDYDIVTVCYNETSTGVRADLEAIGELLKEYPNTLLVVDAVSSMGGDKLLPDEWGTDLVFASTQKCFALPPGLAIGIISQAALERAKVVPDKGLYINIVDILEYYEKKKQTPSTPNISLLYAFDYKLKQMLAEGAENIYKRHKSMADYTHEWALKHGFGLFAEEGYRSVTVTTVDNREKNMDISALNKALAEKGFVIADGYGPFKGKNFRIGHMGDHTLDELKELLTAIEEIWGL